MKLQSQGITMISLKDQRERIGYIGFSFSAALLSPFVQMYRKDLKGTIFYFIIFWLYGQFIIPYIVGDFGVYAGYFAYVILWIFSGFTYNRVQMLILLNDKFKPKHEKDLNSLKEAGYYVTTTYAHKR